MMNVNQDFHSIFLQDDKVFSRLPSRGKRYNSSKQGETSFRVLYYGGATGSVPFTWESQPGTPKHKLSDSPLPPLTPPPQHQSSPSLASPTLRKKHSKIFNSIFGRVSSKKITSPSSSSSSSSPSSSSSYSSSFSLPSTPSHKGISKARLRSIVGFGLDDDLYEPETNYPASTLCFRNGSSCRRSKGCYHPIKSVKKVVMAIVGRRISNH